MTGAEAAAKETERRRVKGEHLVIPLSNENENETNKKGRSEPLLMNWKRMMEEESDEEEVKAREALVQSAAEHLDRVAADNGTNVSKLLKRM